MLAILSGMGSVLHAQSYRVFDWEGKAPPAQPTGNPPPGGAVSLTTYLNGGQSRETNGLEAMTVAFEVSATVWDAPLRWRIDGEGFLSGGAPATFGYQTVDEAEFNFGNPASRVVMRFDVKFGRPVNNPSFFLLDVDNNGSDHAGLIMGTIEGGGVVYPNMSLSPDTTVSWTGLGATLDVFSIGGPVSDNQAAGAVFFEWPQQNVTGFSFEWECHAGSNLRMSNIYAEYDPAGFAVVVPEPGSALLILAAACGLVRRRR